MCACAFLVINMSNILDAHFCVNITLPQKGKMNGRGEMESEEEKIRTRLPKSSWRFKF